VESPFSVGERVEVQSVTEWIFRGIQHAEGAVLPDGMCPGMLKEKWGPWVTECIDLLDAEGAFRNYPCPGSIREQPAYDMEVLRAVRAEWVSLMNEKMKVPNGRKS
jgi:hypothetical protein